MKHTYRFYVHHAHTDTHATYTAHTTAAGLTFHLKCIRDAGYTTTRITTTL